MSLPLLDAIALIEHAETEERDELILKRWIPIQFEISFSDFKARLLAPRKSEKEIMEDTRNILALLHQEKGA